MSSLSMTVPGVVTVTEPCTTVSFVPGGTPVLVGPGLPGGSGTVGDGVGDGVSVGVGVGFGVGLGVGLSVGFGLDVGLPCECEADDEEPVADDTDEGPLDEPGADDTDEGPLDEPDADEAADELPGAADDGELTFVAGSRSITAATTSPPTTTSTSTMTTTRSRTEPGTRMTIRSP
jgi:hypothetical protein